MPMRKQRHANCPSSVYLYSANNMLLAKEEEEEATSGNASSTHSVEIVAPAPAPAPQYNQYFNSGFAIWPLLILLVVGFVWRKKSAKEESKAVPQINADAPNALVVVDMQSYFPAANNPDTIAAVEDEIRQAIQNGYFIVILEYLDCGRTIGSLMKELEGYSDYKVVTKSRDDGSEEVKKACDVRGLAPANISVVGVNTGACVRQTVEGLCRKYPASLVSVIAKACNTEGSYNWSNFPSLKNVVVQH